jgi:hypothetical protein
MVIANWRLPIGGFHSSNAIEPSVKRDVPAKSNWQSAIANRQCLRSLTAEFGQERRERCD